MYALEICMIDNSTNYLVSTTFAFNQRYSQMLKKKVRLLQGLCLSFSRPCSLQEINGKDIKHTINDMRQCQLNYSEILSNTLETVLSIDSVRLELKIRLGDY